MQLAMLLCFIEKSIPEQKNSNVPSLDLNNFVSDNRKCLLMPNLIPSQCTHRAQFLTVSFRLFKQCFHNQKVHLRVHGHAVHQCVYRSSYGDCFELSEI